MRWFQRLTGVLVRDAASLRLAYRAAAKRLHPDRGGRSADFQRMQEAYESLRRCYR